MNETRSKKVGAIVGRFQIPQLTEGHRHLIDGIISKHPKTAVVLCSQGTKNRDSNNPLDYTMRQQMIREFYPNITICPLKDHFSDEVWSQNLDDVLQTTFSTENIVIYGKQDTVVNRYSGCFETAALNDVSGATIREETGLEIVNSADFRRGVIYTTLNKFGCVYPTVDMVIVQNILGELNVLLGRKPIDLKWRFPGGFVGKNERFVQSAVRETMEETNLKIPESAFQYVGTQPIDDWRYQHEDRITTTIFTAEIGLEYPPAKAGDDLSHIRWFKLNKALFEHVQQPHHPILEAALKYYNL